MRITNDSAITLTSGAIVLLGVVVMLGWHFEATRVVQLYPTFTPMQYNSALCFVLAGLAALGTRSRPRLAAMLAISVAAIGLATLLEYVFDVNLGIDELLMRGYIAARTSHPGRMSPQTASGFVLAGSAIAVMTVWRPFAYRELVVHVLASLVGGLGLAVAISYSVGLEPAANPGQFTRVALHTGCGLVVLAAAVLFNARRTRARREPPLLAIPVAVASLAATLSLFLALLDWEHARVAEATKLSVEHAAAALEERLKGYVRSVGALAGVWGGTGGEPNPAWSADVARFLRDEQVFLAISRVGPDGKLDWIFPADPYSDHIGFDYSQSRQRSEAVARARARGGAFLTGTIALKSGKPGVLIVAPLLPAPSDRVPFVVAAALIEDLLDPTVLAQPAYRLAFFEDQQLIYGSAPANGTRPEDAREVRIDAASLQLVATPLPETLAAGRSALPIVLVVIGLLASLLLAATVHLAQVAARRTAALVDANEKLERLALFDELTGLGNRNLLLMELDEALDVARRESAPLPLLFLDLNGFKAVNDTLGHDVGDSVLREFAALLVEAIPLSAEAYRTGGDEFAVLPKPGTLSDEALAIAREIARVTQGPMLIDGDERRIGVSIGIATYPRHGEERSRLMRAADVAMYQAKHASAAIQVASDDAPTAVLRAIRQAQASQPL